MRMLRVDDRVRLTDDVPETDLVRGRIGVICSQWKGDREPLFEVEFYSDQPSDVLRLLLRPTQLEVDAAEEVAVD
jgi:hypothetical protein